MIVAAEESVQSTTRLAIRFVPPTRARQCAQQLLPLMAPDQQEAFVRAMRDKSSPASASASSASAAVAEPRAEQWARLTTERQCSHLQAEVTDPTVSRS